MAHSTPDFIQSKFDLPQWWVCAGLIIINVLLFVWQIWHGMDISNPTQHDALRWGADYAPLTFLQQPWRLFSSMFFHFGLIHLMLNMWALYLFGNVCEKMLGHAYFLGLYVSAGLMGSLLSGYLSIQDSLHILQDNFEPSLLPSVSAGASGAVMGLGACLTVLSLLPALPQQMFILDKKTLLIMMAINLMFGFMVSGINNAAHIGGLCMGAILGGLWYVSQRQSSPRIWQSVAILVAILSCVAVYVYCQHLVQALTPFWSELLSLLANHFNL